MQDKSSWKSDTMGLEVQHSTAKYLPLVTAYEYENMLVINFKRCKDKAGVVNDAGSFIMGGNGFTNEI